jgi:hypothetical protein
LRNLIDSTAGNARDPNGSFRFIRFIVGEGNIGFHVIGSGWQQHTSRAASLIFCCLTVMFGKWFSLLYSLLLLRLEKKKNETRTWTSSMYYDVLTTKLSSLFLFLFCIFYFILVQTSKFKYGFGHKFICIFKELSMRCRSHLFCMLIIYLSKCFKIYSTDTNMYFKN